MITDAAGADVTACYAITYKPGTLRIVSIDASDVSISADTIHLRAGDKVQLVLESRTGGTLPELEWHSDSSAVTVTKKGVVTCNEAAGATITVTLAGTTDVLASCIVNADNLSRMTMPSALEEVAEEAWMNSPMLRVVDLSYTVSPTVGERAFKDCGKLVKVLLPDGVTLADSAFDGCGSVVLYCSDDAAADWAKAHNIPYVYLLEAGE